MTTPEDIEFLSREELLDLVARLQRQLNDLEASNQELRAEVERLNREKKRQATPFSKGNRSTQPKRLGRKPGEGTFSVQRKSLNRPWLSQSTWGLALAAGGGWRNIGLISPTSPSCRPCPDPE